MSVMNVAIETIYVHGSEIKIDEYIGQGTRGELLHKL